MSRSWRGSQSGFPLLAPNVPFQGFALDFGVASVISPLFEFVAQTSVRGERKLQNGRCERAQLDQEIQLSHDHPRRHAERPPTGLPALTDISPLHVCAPRMFDRQRLLQRLLVHDF